MKNQELIDEKFIGIYLYDFFFRNKKKLVFIFLSSFILGFFLFNKDDDFQWSGEIIVGLEKTSLSEKKRNNIRSFQKAILSSSEILMPTYNKVKDNLLDREDGSFGNISYSRWVTRIKYLTNNHSDLIVNYSGYTKNEVQIVLENIGRNYQSLDKNNITPIISKANEYLKDQKIILEEKLSDSEIKLNLLNNSINKNSSDFNEREKIILERDIKNFSNQLNKIEEKLFDNFLDRSLYKSSVSEISKPNILQINKNLLLEEKYISIFTFSLGSFLIISFLMIIRDRLRDKLFLKEEIDILFPHKFLFSLKINKKKELFKQKEYLRKFFTNYKKDYQIFYIGNQNKDFLNDFCNSLISKATEKNQLLVNELIDLDLKKEVILFIGSSDIRRNEISLIREYFELFNISVKGWIFLKN